MPIELPEYVISNNLTQLFNTSDPHMGMQVIEIPICQDVIMCEVWFLVVFTFTAIANAVYLYCKIKELKQQGRDFRGNPIKKEGRKETGGKKDS